MTKTAFITGITGQDGSYLAELLMDKGYHVHGLVRRSSTFSTERIDHIYSDVHDEGRLRLHYGDLTDGQALTNLVLEIEPDEIYNLGAQSHVRVSYDQPIYTLETVGVGALNVLEAARLLNRRKQVRVYQASSSEMFGEVLETPQKETTPFNPQSPYACAKVYAFHQTVNYRRGYDMYASNGILFNHESERRGETFVTRKITRAAGRIKTGMQSKLYLGNLDAKRDWGYAKDYVEVQWLMLQQDKPSDFVIATGKQYSVRDFINLTAKNLDMKIEWKGKGEDEIGIYKNEEIIKIDTNYYRPTEVESLLGDASKAKKELGWEPKISFEELVKEMVEKDLKSIS